MPSFKQCIDQNVKLGKIKPTKAALAKRAWDTAEAEARAAGLEGSALRDAASLAAVAKITKGTKARKWAMVNNILKTAELKLRFDGTDRPDQELTKLFDELDIAKWRVHKQATALMEENIIKHSPRYGGLYNPTKHVDNIVRSMYDEDVGDAAARVMAKEYRAVKAFYNKRANLEGASLAGDPDGRPPMQFDRLKMRQAAVRLGPDAARTQWISKRLEDMDFENHGFDEWLGEEIPVDAREHVLEEWYDAIMSQGNNRRAASFIPGALVNKLNHQQLLYFKDADSWIRANEEFGSGNVFQQMISYSEIMARDIAIMEKMGPNPAAQLENLTGTGGLALFRANQVDKKIAKGKSSMLNATRKAGHHFKQRYELHMHHVMNGDESRMAQGLGTARTMTLAAVLSHAFLPAMGDVGFGKYTLQVNNIPSVGYIRRAMTEFVKMPSETRRREAIRAGLGAEGATEIALAMQRYLGPLDGARSARLISDGMFRMSLMTPWTQGGRWASGKHLMSSMAEVRNSKFADLPWRASLEKAGITEADWDIYRRTKTVKIEGDEQLRPIDMLSRSDLDEVKAQRISDKFFDWQLGLGRMMVPFAGTGELATLGHSLPANTLMGQVGRTFAAVKTFNAVVLMLHMRDMAAQPTWGGAASRAIKFTVMLTIAGAFITQMKELARFNDPRDMISGNFWLRSLLNGGSLGFLGDVMFNNVYSYQGSGLADIIGGPVAEFWTDARNLTITNAQEIASGDTSHFGREMLTFVQKYAPIPWEVAGAMDRLVFNQIMALTDPQAYRREVQKQRRRETEYNQKSWWKVGDKAPSRLPDPRAAIGGSRR